MDSSQGPSTGKVYLVGAGPGDPGLITLKGVECLQRADLVLADHLVHAAILKHVAPSAELVRLGRAGQSDPVTPAEVLTRMIAAAQEGKVVVHLRGVDSPILGVREEVMKTVASPDAPLPGFARSGSEPVPIASQVLGRGAHEINALRRAGIPYELVPGVTATPAADESWYARRPLSGVRVLVTRARHQAASLAERLAELGAETSFQPAIDISDPPDWGPIDRALSEISQFDWLVFSSANGVGSLLERLWKGHGDLRLLAGVRLAAIGPGTAEELARYRLRADLVPGQYRAEALAEALGKDAAGRRFLLARASRGREVLAEELVRAGGRVDQVVVYRSSDVSVPDVEVAASLAAGRIDWVTVTSSAIAKSLAQLFGEHLRQARLASISPVTSETLRRLGYAPAVEACQYTMAGLVEAIVGARKAES